jgi:hypothetical protein
MVTVAHDLVGHGQRILGRVEALRATAREAEDVLRRDCLGEKLLRLKGAMFVAHEATLGLERAVARQSIEGWYREFSRVTLSYLKMQVLGEEAGACMLEKPGPGDRTSVEVEELGRRR